MLSRSGMTERRTKRRWWLWLRPVIYAAFLFFMLRWFEHRQVYQPFARLETTGHELGRPFEDATFGASDGVKLNGWFFPADTNSPRAPLAFLICHGNAGNISHRLGHVAALLQTGASVFVFDYRGYGRSEGRPDEPGTYLDAQAAHAWLRQKGFAGTNIVAIGESLGGGVASELAVREPLGGLVLLCTFTSVADLGAEWFPWLPVRWFGSIKYDTRAKLPRLRLPVVVIHSRADTLIRFPHAERNFAVANEPKLLWEIAGDHNDFIEVGREQYVAGVEKFLDLVGPNRSTPQPW
jgi:hypothetical protein